MIIKCFPKNGGWETEEVNVIKKVMFKFNVVSCEVIDEIDKKHPSDPGHVDTVLLVKTKEDEGSFRFKLNDYHVIYLMGDDGKTVDKFTL